MSTSQSLQRERALLRPRRRRSPTGEQLVSVDRLVWQLPVVVSGRWSSATPLGNADASLRLQAALWELAARHHIPFGADATVADVAALLAERGALSTGAATAARILADALAHDGFDETACWLAGRLVAHLELRARYG